MFALYILDKLQEKSWIDAVVNPTKYFKDVATLDSSPFDVMNIVCFIWKDRQRQTDHEENSDTCISGSWQTQTQESSGNILFLLIPRFAASLPWSDLSCSLFLHLSAKFSLTLCSSSFHKAKPAFIKKKYDFKQQNRVTQGEERRREWLRQK